ncbi:ATP-binding protein, partial [Streptomyces sp. GC420]|uniref:ATP-binding protein n=1 Tax=Streptomyces sp. GC420 TaxID=2697568 RepID=UPI001415190E
MTPVPPYPRVRQKLWRRERRSVPGARLFTRAVLRNWGYEGRNGDIELCVSELATNALLHGVPPGRGYLLRLRLCANGLVRVEVHDGGGGVVEPSWAC